VFLDFGIESNSHLSTMTTQSVAPTRWRKLAIQAGVLAAVLLALAWRARPDGRLHVIFLESKGDAALIQTPAGGYVLVDGGGDPAALTATLGRRLPFWQRKLEAVVLTSADGAHLPGQVAALARYRVALALAPPALRQGAVAKEWLRLLDDGHTRVRAARPGDQLRLGGATLRVLAVGDGGESGLVLRIDYGTTSVVLDHMGGEADEKALLAGMTQPATLLVFPWQRDPRTAFVEALRPRALVFTDGQTADKPAELTFVDRADGGAALYHERLNGTIEWVSDGRRAWVVAER
jgi:beta-lactamase superfamily II metal-dependent hydrolase